MLPNRYINHTKAISLILGASLIMSGCMVSQLSQVMQTQLTDFDDETVEVTVGYLNLGVFGKSPNASSAQESGLVVAMEHCESLGKDTIYNSYRDIAHNADQGEYVILYRCEDSGSVGTD